MKLRARKSGMPGKTKNHEGGEAFHPTSKEHELTLSVCSCMYREPQFYERGNDIAQRIADLVTDVDTEYVVKLAEYARNEMHLRSTPIFLLILATAKRDYPIKDHVKNVCMRADDLLEYMGGYVDMVGRPIPSAMKRGINDALKYFTEYHIGKYQGGNRKWTWKGLVKMTHPKEPDYLLKKIMEKDGESIQTPYTWETELSAKGNKREVWEMLIDSKRLPYMASIRNVRNMLKAGIGDAQVQKVADYIRNPDIVKKSRQLPFRFLSSYRAMSGHGNMFHATMLRDALSDAMDVSAFNVDVLPGKTEIVIDVSGSMNASVSRMSDVTLKEAGAVLGAVATKIMPESIISVFADNVGIMTRMRAGSSIIEETERICRQRMGGSTMGYKVFEEAIHANRFVDRFVFFTDCELYTEEDIWWGMTRGGTFRKTWLKYKAEINSKAKLYIVNLASNALMPVSSVDKDVMVMSGFSENVFKVIKLTEQSIDAQVKFINQYVYVRQAYKQSFGGDSDDEGVHRGDDRDGSEG